MSDIGTAYVKIEPTAKGISQKIAGEMGSAGEASGSSFGQGFARVAGGVGKVVAGAIGAGAAAVGGVVTSAVSEFSNFEQLAGGIETLFDNSANARAYGEVLKGMGESAEYVAREVAEVSQIPIDTVMNNAARAYETAGMSANDYMETVIGMAAALNNSTGDLEVSAELADMAVRDMSDNVNKMGTSMESVQNAYRGFSRGNFTMLDNLALGFAGTKEGMQELLDSANAISGVEYDISSYADIVEAIHVVQDEMGITGTTANEAATTIQGSLSMTQAAWSNLITGIGSGADLTPLINNLVSSMGTLAGNVMPVVETALQGVSQLIAQIAPVIATELPGLITSILPGLLDAGVQIIQTLGEGILNAIPELLPLLGQVGTSLFETFNTLLPQAVEVGIQVITELANGLSQALPTLIPAVVNALMEIVSTLTDPGNIQMIIQAAIDLFMGLGQGLMEAIPQLVAQLPTIIENICTAVLNALPLLIQAAIDLVLLLAQNLPTIIISLVEAIPSMIETVVIALISALPVLIEGLIQLVVQLVTHLPEIIMALIMAIPDIIVSIVEAFSGIVEALGGLFSKAWDGIKNVFSNVGGWFSEKFTQAKEAASTAWSTVKDQFSQSWEATKQVFSTVGSWFSERFTEARENAATAWSTVKDQFSRSWEATKQVFSTVGSWFSEKFTEARENAATAWEGVKERFSAVKTNITNMYSTINSWFADKFRAAASGIKQAFESIQTFFENVKNKILNAFSNIKDKFLEIGSNIVGGIKDGISNAWENFMDWLSRLFNGIVDKIKSILKIGSPSKVFADEVGRWIPAGIAEGIEDGIGVLNSAMADMTEAVSPIAMGDINAYTPRSGSVQNENAALYDLLSRYLPIIASGENVNVSLDVDGQRLFRVIQQQQQRNTQLVGVGANA